MTLCFSANNMAAEDLPSEFDVVILGTGTPTPGLRLSSNPDHVVAGARSETSRDPGVNRTEQGYE